MPDTADGKKPPWAGCRVPAATSACPCASDHLPRSVSVRVWVSTLCYLEFRKTFLHCRSPWNAARGHPPGIFKEAATLKISGAPDPSPTLCHYRSKADHCSWATNCQANAGI